MFAPPTLRLVLLPLQIVALEEPVSVGALLTVTPIVLAVLHEPLVAVTVYVMELAGDATTVAPVVVLSPVAGAHA